MPSSSVNDYCNDAERLISLAKHLTVPRKVLIDCRSVTGKDLAEAVLAIKFYYCGAGLKFKALVEGWNRQRIVREVY